jgi:hypothetical protein
MLRMVILTAGEVSLAAYPPLSTIIAAAAVEHNCDPAT